VPETPRRAPQALQHRQRPYGIDAHVDPARIPAPDGLLPLLPVRVDDGRPGPVRELRQAVVVPAHEALYRSILYPDQGISFGYEGYSFKLKDGSEAFGMIASETENEVEIKYINNKQIINKADIVSREQIDNSLMPSNLQAGMTEQDLVDLVEYLKTLKGKGS
jgi:putative heme-binding domain-containing protein